MADAGRPGAGAPDGGGRGHGVAQGPRPHPAQPSGGSRRPGRLAAGGRRPPSAVGIIAVATAALVAALVTFGIFLPALGAIGDAITRDPATLPDRIAACGRDWQRDPLARELTGAEVFERTEAPPVVVSTSLFAPCPAEANADGQLVTALYVRTGSDAYVAYDLVGSP